MIDTVRNTPTLQQFLIGLDQSAPHPLPQKMKTVIFTTETKFAVLTETRNTRKHGVGIRLAALLLGQR